MRTKTDVKNRTPNFSDMPPLNVFEVSDGFRSTDPFSEVMDRLGDPRSSRYARVDLVLPLGCPFSLFLVSGYPKGEEWPARVATLVVSRELAVARAEHLREADILEFPVLPPAGDDSLSTAPAGGDPSGRE